MQSTSLPWIHQEYTFKHRSACRTPAESRQEYLSRGEEHIELGKTRDQALSLWSGSPDPKTLDYQRSSPQSAQFSRSVMSDLWDPMNRSTPGLPVYHRLLEFTQTHVCLVDDAIQPSHPLLLLLSRDPTDGSPPGSAIPGILQARTLEWVAISFSNT